MIGNEIAVLIKKMINILPMPRGILDPKITPPTSDKYSSCEIESAATINLDISADSAPMIRVGRYISVNPMNRVFDTRSASGTPNISSNGTNGAPIQVKIGVYSAAIVPSVPIAITTGSTPNHISSTVLYPSLAIPPIPEAFFAVIKA